MSIYFLEKASLFYRLSRSLWVYNTAPFIITGLVNLTIY